MGAAPGRSGGRGAGDERGGGAGAGEGASRDGAEVGRRLLVGALGEEVAPSKDGRMGATHVPGLVVG